jgi:PAS domain S-box-containing protein
MSSFFPDEDAEESGGKPQAGLFAAIVEAWDGLIYVGTADFRIRYLNRRFIEQLGRDATGELCFRALHGRDEPCPWCPREVFRGQSVRGRFQKPLDGRWYDVLNAPLPLPDGTFAKVAFIRESPEPHPASRDLPVFRNLVDRLDDAIFFLDSEDGRLLYVNEAACRNLGYPREELLKMKTWEFSENLASPDEWRQMVAHIRGEGSFLFETRYLRRDRSFLEVEVNATVVHAGLQQFIVSVARDITERRRLEQCREEVFSVVSHQLRTPLTAILGFAEYLIENETAKEEQREFLNLIVSESEQLQDLIDNLLSLQRLQAGFGLENLEPVPISSLFRELVDAFRSPLIRRRFKIECPPDLPAVFGDELKLQQAVRNLLENALKYSPEGSRIDLGARVQGFEVLLWVRDKGPGIPPDKQERVFERFYRGGEGKGPAGTGLGLALVREIVQAHGGRVWVESIPGEGSTFFLALPVAP